MRHPPHTSSSDSSPGSGAAEKEWESGLTRSPAYAAAVLVKNGYGDCGKESVVLVSRVSRTNSQTTNYSKPLEKWMEEGSRGEKDKV